MKKILALLLTLAMVLALCACGGDGSSTNGGSGSSGGDPVQLDPAPSGTSDAQGGADDPMQTQPVDGNATHLSYDDLTRTERMSVWPDDDELFDYEIDCPDFRFESYGWGIGSEHSLEYAIVVANPERPVLHADTSLADAFEQLLNGPDGYHSILKSVDRASYADIVPETATLTLDCGREAIHFTATVQQDDYGTLTDCPLYGYCTLLNGMPVIVSYIVLEPDKVDDDTLALAAHYVDEMVNTLRIVEE